MPLSCSVIPLRLVLDQLIFAWIVFARLFTSWQTLSNEFSTKAANGATPHGFNAILRFDLMNSSGDLGLGA